MAKLNSIVFIKILILDSKQSLLIIFMDTDNKVKIIGKIIHRYKILGRFC